MEQSAPKRRHIKFRRRGITQKKEYNIQNTRKFEIKNISHIQHKHLENFFLNNQPDALIIPKLGVEGKGWI